MFDYYRISMTGFFAIALLLCAVAPICLFWEPMYRLWPISLFGPYVAAVLWLVILIMAVQVHRWRGLWLLVTAIAIVPMTYLHFGLVIMCALTGNCI
jgi:hypothetical protein